jgi:CheY-like chemotaxis protein
LEAQEKFENIWALVVEDDAHSLIAIGKLLREHGISFKRNTTGAQVICQITDMQPRPDFILLDLDLPQGDSLQICSAIRHSQVLNNLPIIAIGDYQIEMLPKLRRCGFASFLPKPLPRKQFADYLGRILAGEEVWEAGV